MSFQDITLPSKNVFNQLMHHPLQTYEWGEFRKKTGVKVIRRGFFEKDKLKEGFQLTIHKIPHTPLTIGYLPKNEFLTKKIIEELEEIGKREKCIFIQIEPNIQAISNCKIKFSDFDLRQAAHPLFTRYTFTLDLTKSEEELLENMHHKTRYNIRLAKKHGVTVQEDNSDKAFEEYLRLTKETAKRQRFYAHTEKYHRLMWETLKTTKKVANRTSVIHDAWQMENRLTAHLLTATYRGKTLAAWIIFVFKDTLFYPYGASSSEHREVMASTLMMWEAIRFGKRRGLKKFDMWGALSPEQDQNVQLYGFHRFKAGFGPELIEFVGSYDLVINQVLYQAYKLADKLRWFLLRLKHNIPNLPSLHRQ